MCCVQAGLRQRKRRTPRRRARMRPWQGRSATVRRYRLGIRSVAVPQQGQAAVEEVERSRATTVVGVRTRSSRRRPGHCGRGSRRNDITGMLLARKVSGGTNEIPSVYGAAAPSRRQNHFLMPISKERYWYVAPVTSTRDIACLPSFQSKYWSKTSRAVTDAFGSAQFLPHKDE